MSSIESNWTSLLCNFCGILEIKLSFLSLSLPLSLSFSLTEANPIFLSITQIAKTSYYDDDE